MTDKTSEPIPKEVERFDKAPQVGTPTAVATDYGPATFSNPAKDCDLIMKGGVTSGLVYPYAILELAKVYRFRSIGGTSAGGIAAAFAAAAEYSRSVRNDPAGFSRLQRHCDDLPTRLSSLFQPSPKTAPLMRLLMGAQASVGGLGVVAAVLRSFPLSIAMGCLGGAGLLWLAGGGVAGSVLGGLVGAVSALITRLLWLMRQLPRQGFGLCPGLTQPGRFEPGLTDWLHRAIQDIAFGDADHPDPLTFGHLEADPAHRIELRMVTTNLSMRRPHTLPQLGLPAAFSPDQWKTLFPEPVITHLASATRPHRRLKGFQSFPTPEALPVLVAVRMSLSFPFLFSAVPMVMRDVHGAMLSRRSGGEGRVYARPLWFSDGGLSSNFPIHMFDALLPGRPTFALSLDDLPPASTEPAPDPYRRVMIPQSAGDGLGLPIHPIDNAAAFASSLLGAAKDWQDNLMAGMPGQRQRIARVLLSKREGGLNLTMPPEVSRALMAYGQEVGRRFADGAFDFDEHRWRRLLIAYEQVELALDEVDETWNQQGFAAWYRSYRTQVKSYKAVSQRDRQAIQRRMTAFAALSETFAPPISGKARKMPRPTGVLRIGPRY